MSGIKRVSAKLIIPALCSALAAPVALAQQGQQPTQGQQAQQSQPSSQGQQGQKGQVVGKTQSAQTARMGVTREQATLVARGIRASELVDKDVYNDRNQKIGAIDDFIVSKDGKLSVAVVDVGGFLGMGEHRIAIPVNQFSQIQPRVVLPGATEEGLKQLPQFEYQE